MSKDGDKNDRPQDRAVAALVHLELHTRDRAAASSLYRELLGWRAVMVAGSYRPLEDAFRIAHTQLIRWISTEIGLSEMDAYQLVSQASSSPIAPAIGHCTAT